MFSAVYNQDLGNDIYNSKDIQNQAKVHTNSDFNDYDNYN
jgi:hypothetical protein